jgi:hypothetical protein
MERDLGWRKLLGNMRAAKGRAVIIGYYGGERHNRSTADLASIAAAHEFGFDTEDAEIPARPVWGPTLDKRAAGIQEFAARLGTAVKERAIDIERALGLVGQRVADEIRNGYLRSEGLAPLAPSTIAARRRRSVGSSKPLVDTRQLVNSIRWKTTFRVTPKGGPGGAR